MKGLLAGVARVFLIGTLMGLPLRDALGFFDPLRFVPASPSAGQPISFHIRFGVCDFIVAANADDRDVVVVGSTVRVTVNAFEAVDKQFCVVPIAEGDINITSLPSGNYRFELYKRDVSSPARVVLIQSTSLIVGPAPPEAIPTLGIGSVVILAGAVLMVLHVLVRLNVHVRR